MTGIICIRNAYPLPRQWEETATAREIGMPNNKGMRRQPQPREVGGAKLLSPLLLPLNSVELAKRRAKSKQF